MGNFAKMSEFIKENLGKLQAKFSAQLRLHPKSHEGNKETAEDGSGSNDPLSLAYGTTFLYLERAKMTFLKI